MNQQEISASKLIGNHSIKLGTNVMAKQANGSVVVSCQDMVLLATATMSKSPKTGIDFFPLTIEFSEKMYSAGKIPGGFFKREARPSTDATLLARLIDRPLRPLFPKGIFNEVQIIITVLSYDPEVALEPLAISAASAALSVSDIPFNGPVGGCLVGKINGELIPNPSREQQANSTLNIVVAGSSDAILMVESESKEVSEEEIIDAIMFGHNYIKEIVQLQNELAQKAPKEKIVFEGPSEEAVALSNDIDAFLGDTISKNLRQGNKEATESFLSELGNSVIEKFENDEQDNHGLIKSCFEKVKKAHIRNTVIKERIRPDGRQLDEVRPIDIQVGLLPSVHGSSLFTRGETQSLGTITLGTADDQQIIDGLNDTHRSSYYFHYNFPPYSVGETGRIGTGRREQGHGALAQRALAPVLPDGTEFPYTLRIVSEILESNGSSSMASVCSGSLALMDCGVPIKAAVSGIAMGLLIEDGNYIILSDIQGLEDHYGDMDFKVAGTSNGITALQLDIKVSGLSKEILTEALAQAKQGRLGILNKMNTVLDQPRQDIASNAPQITSIMIPTDKIGVVIGPGGKMIRKIEEETRCSINISDDPEGQVNISAKNQADLSLGLEFVKNLVKEPEIGEVYSGKVVKIATFGAFIEVLPGKEGLVHISKLSKSRINKVEDVISVGDQIEVKINNIDDQKRINLVPTQQFN